MAWRCTRVIGRDCDGCGRCGRPVAGGADDDADDPLAPAVQRRCEECKGALEDGYYYDIEGTILCGYCVDKLFRREVEMG